MIDPLEAEALRGLTNVWRLRAARQNDDDVGTGLKMATEKCCEDLELIVGVLERQAANAT